MTSRDTYDIKEYELEQYKESLLQIARFNASLQIQFNQEMEHFMTNVIYYRVAGDVNAHCPNSVHTLCVHCEGETFFLMTEEQYNKWKVRGFYIQDVFPELHKEVREWMISGTHPDCWEQVFGLEEN